MEGFFSNTVSGIGSVGVKVGNGTRRCTSRYLTREVEIYNTSYFVVLILTLIFNLIT